MVPVLVEAESYGKAHKQNRARQALLAFVVSDAALLAIPACGVGSIRRCGIPTQIRAHW